MLSCTFVWAALVKAVRRLLGKVEKSKCLRSVLFLGALGLLCIGQTLDARPVSYPEGTTVMMRNNGVRNSLHLHYSPTKDYSLGYRAEYWRDLEFQMHSIQMNYLVQRWNQIESQANLYLKSGIGWAYREAKHASREEEEKQEERQESEEKGEGKTRSEGVFFGGIAADWETQRYYLAYGNRYVNAGQITAFYAQNLRIGIAPYIGEYGALHTWIMLDLRHEPAEAKPFTFTPLLRFFKSVHLIELGIEDTGKALFNWVIRF